MFIYYVILNIRQKKITVNQKDLILANYYYIIRVKITP